MIGISIFMVFDKQKEHALSRIDNSKKGSIDEGIKELVDLINSYSDYYTASSCAGRISIVEISERKIGTNWLIAKHAKVDFDEVKTVLKEG